MVISDRKPMEEILGFLKDAKKIILVGCNQCAAASKTGGEPELEEMKALLEAEGKEVTGILLPDTACNLLLGKKELKSLNNAIIKKYGRDEGAKYYAVLKKHLKVIGKL